MSSAKTSIKAATAKYQWAQSPDAVTVYIPLKNVLLRNIDIFYSDSLMKINAQSIKYFSAIDFLYRIDHKNPKSRFQLIDGRLECLLIKANPGQNWETLEVEGLSKAEITQRRSEAETRYYAREKADKEKAQALQ